MRFLATNASRSVFVYFVYIFLAPSSAFEAQLVRKSKGSTQCSAVVRGETKLPPERSVQRRRSIIWTCISCLTEHDKNKVYQSVNIDVPIGDLDCGIP